MKRNMGFFGIYPDAINNAVDECEIALKGLGFSNAEINEMYQEAEELLESAGSFKEISNSIIYSHFEATRGMILEKYPEIDVDYFVNCSDSHFYVNGEEQI